VWAQDHVVELRGLYVDTEAKSLRFDATVELGYRDFQGTRAIIESKCQEALPGWTINVRVIPDVSD
jgi:hypothetical protein